MTELLETLGMLFFMLLVLAAAVEVVLEVFRGVLEKFVGITWAKSKVSLEDALALAEEFAPGAPTLQTKIDALTAVADQFSKTSAERLKTLEELKESLPEATGKDLDKFVSQLNREAADIKREYEKSERTRLYVMRSVAAVVGCLLVWISEFHVFEILANAPENEDLLAGMEGLTIPWINVVVGGLAAAAGSSFWHDQLDRIRSLKGAASNLKVLRS